MPSTMTHTYFGLDVYNQLPSYCQQKIKNKIEYFKLFCQGSDPFMFYHFFLGKKAKKVGQIQSQMHHTNTQKFFLAILNTILQSQLQNDEEVMAYLYGYICHYYLDYTTHPYIFYKTGIFNPQDKTTYRYNGVHQQAEYIIDMYLIQEKEKMNPAKFKIHHHIFQVDSFSSNLENIINESIGKTYSIPNVAPLYLKSTKYMKKFFQYINYDPLGWKFKTYSIMDKLTPPSIIQLKILSFHQPYQDHLSFLNLEHKPWHYPWEQKPTFTTSFLDLYQEAQTEAIQTIKEITTMLNNQKLDQARLHSIFQDLSFATGKPCSKKLELKYFEY